jgi:peptidylprolyl isomerase
MIKNIRLSIFLTAFMLILSLPGYSQKEKKDSKKDAKKDVASGPLVEIKTDMGTMIIRLYNETPQHRDNFLKLADKGFYDSLLFHRVIKGFMIQGGDPESKNAAAGQMLGNGDVGYTVPAEFNDALFHKKGTLCAARTENPEKASSGCQFYIVQGKIMTDAELDGIENRVNVMRKQMGLTKAFANPANAAIRDHFVELKKTNQNDSVSIYMKTVLEPLAEKEMKPFKYTPEQRNIYKTIGGTPSLDQGYTVYGEVIEGLDVIDKIAAVQTGTADRPVTDVRMKVRVLEKGK